jgi:large subunit ribosomal protein L7/L12
MSIAYQNAAKSCIRFICSSSSLRVSSLALSKRRNTPLTHRWASTDAASNPKIVGIVDQISQLTLLETADLVASLKVGYLELISEYLLPVSNANTPLKSRLNIPDMPMGNFVAAGGQAGPAAAAPVEEEEVAPTQQEKTLFNLKLESFDAAAKPKIIKEIKSMLGLSLVDSKKFVESAPKMMKESVPKEEAEKIIAAMKALGGVATME